MPLNTTSTLVGTTTSVKSITGADTTGTTGTTTAAAYWFNDSSPANSLAFAAVSGVVNVWRTDLQTTTALTSATRLGYFTQGSNVTITDLKFVTSGSTGYLIAAATTNIFVYAIDLNSIPALSSLGGDISVQSSSLLGVTNFAIGATQLDLIFGDGLYQQSLPVNQQFRTAIDSTIYQISSSTINNLGTGIISQATGSFSGALGIAYAPAAGARGERLYVVNYIANTISIINPTNNSLVGTISAATGSFNSPYGIVYTPAAGARGERLYVANSNNSTVSIIDPTNNSLVGIISAATGSFSIPVGIAYAPTAGAREERLYVANDNNTVSIIDPTNNTLVGTISQATGSFNRPRGAAYAPAAGARGERLYVANFGSSTVSIIDPTNNTLVGTISAATGSFNGAFSIAYAPAAGARGERLYVANNNNSTVSIIDPTNNTLVGTISQATGSFNGPASIAYAPTVVYVTSISSHTVSIINTFTNTLSRGFANRINFERVNSTGGLSSDAPPGTPLICNGPFYTARLRLLSATSPKIVINTVNNFLLVQNTTNIYLYRNINLSVFDGTNNVTVNGISIPPFTSSVGYYNINTPAAVLTATTTNIAFYYKATNAYILATFGTHQWVIYRLNADTLSSTIASPTTPTIAATFSTNTLNASSIVQDVSVIQVGSNLIVLTAGTAINLLYRFATTAYDSTNNTAVAGSAALIQFPHGQATTAIRLAALYQNTTTGRTLLFTANNTDVSIYQLDLTAFDGTNAAIVKVISITPSSGQYTLRAFHASFRVTGFTSILNSNFDNAISTNPCLINPLGILNLINVNRGVTELTLLNERFTTAPALTKSNANTPITLSSSIDAYQALNVLGIASNFVALNNAATYSNSEYYPWNYLVTDDTAGTLSESFTFSGATAGIVGDYRITVVSGTVTLGTKGIYNDSFTLQSGTTLALVADATLSTEFILNSGVSVVRATGATGSYTLTIPYANPGLSVGANITLAFPQPTLTFTGLPAGGIFTIWDDEIADPQDLGTALQTTNPTTGNAITYVGVAGNAVVFQFVPDSGDSANFQEFNISGVIPATSQTIDFTANLEREVNL